MTKQFFGIYPWLALIALLLSGCQSSPVAVESTPSDTPQMAETPAAGATLEPGYRAPLWTFSTDGEIWSSPAVQDGVVYFGSDNHFLYALDLKTRALKWKFKAGDIVRSRPAVAGGTVYFAADDNQLYALDARSGKAVWQFDMGKPFEPRSPIPKSWDYMQSSPAVADGVVYVGSAGSNFFAVDAKTGKEKWRVPVGLYVRSSPVVVDGVVYVGSKYPCLFAFDAQTGEQKWCFAYGNSWVESSAAVVDGVVYVGSSDWDRINAVDAATGELKWYFTTKGDPWCSPAVSDGVVYIGATGGFFYALDAASGAEKWRVRTDKALTTVDVRFDGGVVSSPVVADATVYFGGLDGRLYAVSTAP